MGDAFYRWDGFSYYGSFFEFFVSASLAAVLWSITALTVSALLWFVFSGVTSISRYFGLNINSKYLIFYFSILLLVGSAAWKVKRLIWPNVQTTLHLKITLFIAVVVISIFIIWIIRRKVEQWLDAILERITPLLWLFGIFVAISGPLVVYHSWIKDGTSTGTAILMQPPAQSRPNIILVTFDALTARNMSVYGYQRDTTPFISEWARNASVFTMAEAESNFTTSATASLMTGKRVWTHQTFHIEGTKPVNSHIESLPSVLKEHGYFNMAYVVNPHTSVEILGMDNSFDIAPLSSDFSEPASLVGWQFGVLDVFLHKLFGNKIKMHNWVLKNDFILKKILRLISKDFSLTTVPADKVFNRFLQEVDDNPQRPFFAWIHVFPPHDPYLPPKPFMHTYNASSEFRVYKAQEEIKLESYKFLFQYLSFPEEMQPAVDLMRDYYDEFILYSDTMFREFAEKFDKKKIGNTLFILSADHGESFEHGYFTHGGPFLYEQVTHIPLIIKEPGQNKRKVISDVVEQIDISATILDLANIPVPSWMEGRSLVPLMRGKELPAQSAFAMNFEENRSRGNQIVNGSIAVWDGDYKLIHYLQKNESLLYNIKEDPDEKNDLFERNTEVRQKLLNIIQGKLEKINDKIRNVE